MGTYIHPSLNGFRRVLLTDYIDRTGIIAYINDSIDNPESMDVVNPITGVLEVKNNNLICLSLPRRDGKTTFAVTLGAYYDCQSDSHAYFRHLAIAKSEGYEQHMNQYHVISLDIAGMLSIMRHNQYPGDIVSFIIAALKREAAQLCDELAITPSDILEWTLGDIVRKTRRRFIFIIDEWDAVIREYRTQPEIQQVYLELLRGWFKNTSFTTDIVAAAFMTGILPIKKDGGQSAISSFSEYSILAPGPFAPYIGFHTDDVERLCQTYGMEAQEVAYWYEGYTAGDYHFYTPYSVILAMKNQACRDYWRESSSAEGFTDCIAMDFTGLRDCIQSLMSGNRLLVDTRSFRNDTVSFHSVDDILTLLIHFGYLTYEKPTEDKLQGVVSVEQLVHAVSIREKEEAKAGEEAAEVGELSMCEEDFKLHPTLFQNAPYKVIAKIPNIEVLEQFRQLMRDETFPEFVALGKRSKQLLLDTIHLREAEVAAAIAKVHESIYAPTFYNNEQALRSVIRMGYIICGDYYIKIEEMPSGHGQADIVFIPIRGVERDYPALIIELKWNKSAVSAIHQINENHYQAVFANYTGQILFVGVNYSTKTKVHTCKITRFTCKDGVAQAMGR